METDENSDPKKFIEQLSGKLGQSLRKYTDQIGNPDFELEKFVVNSALSATHTSEMDPQDQDDIIKKVKEAGSGEQAGGNGEQAGGEEPEAAPDNNELPTNDLPVDDKEPKMGEDPLAESEGFMLAKPKKLSIFAPKGSDEAKWKESIKTKLKESFNQTDMSEPAVAPKPIVKPQTQPNVAPIKPSRRNKPFQPTTPAVNPAPKAGPKIAMDEVGSNGKKTRPQIYHESFTGAIEAAKKYANDCGYTVSEDECFSKIGAGPARPDEGVTNRYSLELFKDGKLQKKHLHIQVYGMPKQFELNTYIA